jgi:hypothetical protein
MNFEVQCNLDLWPLLSNLNDFYLNGVSKYFHVSDKINLTNSDNFKIPFLDVKNLKSQ